MSAIYVTHLLHVTYVTKNKKRKRKKGRNRKKKRECMRFEELEHEGCPPAVAKGRLLASALYASLGQDPPADVKAEAAHPPDEHAKISLI